MRPGVQTMRTSDYLYSGKVLNTLGYCMDFKMTRLARLTALNFRGLVDLLFFRKRKKNAPPEQKPAPFNAA